LTGRQSLRFVVLPQAVRRVVPPLLNDFISLQKDVALVSILGPLDPELVGEVLELIRELKADGMTMVIATHEMAFAREVADEVCFLHDGAILERGAPAQVIDAPSVPETQRFLRRLG
jgi:ABC-type histidine transport system ATPase subunit